MKSIFYLSLLSGCAYFGWTFVSNQTEQKKVEPQEVSQPAQKAKASPALPSRPIPSDTVQMSNEDRNSKYQLYVRKANSMDMEKLSTRVEKMDKKTFDKTDAVVNYKPQDIGNKRVHQEAKTPSMTTSKYTYSSTPSEVQTNSDSSAPVAEKKKLSKTEEEMLKTNKGLSEANDKVQSDFQKNVNKLQEVFK